MSQKFTPGPWVYALEYGPTVTEPPRVTTVGRCANYVIGLPSDYPGGNYRDGDPCGDEEADARLMAAAPDLYEALKELIDMDVAYQRGPKVSDAVDKAHAALAKAEGKQS